MGSTDAKVAVVEFSDFQCPYCSQFANNTLPELKAKYVDTGRLMFVFRHNPLTQIHARAEAAAHASECASQQGRFWQLHDLMFKDPKKLEQTDLLGYAEQAGLEPTRFTACLDEGLSERVTRDAALAKALKLTGTPVFMVGRLTPGRGVTVSQVLTGAQTTAEFATAVDNVLKKAGVGN